MKVVDYVVDYHQFLLKFKVFKVFIDGLRLELLRENVAIVNLVNLLHQLGPVHREILHILTCFSVHHRTLLIQGIQVEYITVEGTLDEFADGLLIEKLVGVVCPLRLSVEIDEASIVHSLADVFWHDDDVGLFWDSFLDQMRFQLVDGRQSTHLRVVATLTRVTALRVVVTALQSTCLTCSQLCLIIVEHLRLHVPNVDLGQHAGILIYADFFNVDNGQSVRSLGASECTLVMFPIRQGTSTINV